MPLRHVYTSLFSTGLHLQNSLLRIRHMEGLFEALEKSKDKETVANFMPNEKQLLEWLQVNHIETKILSNQQIPNIFRVSKIFRTN